MNIKELEKSLVLARSSEEVFERGVKACKQASTLQHRNRLEAYRINALQCVSRAYQAIDTHLKDIVEKTPFLKDLHPLFRELLLLRVNADEFKVCLSRVNSARKVLGKIYAETRRKIKYSHTAHEIREARRAFFGRTLSLVETLDICFKKIREAQEAFLKLPDVDTEARTIVIAGAPNVGKSTLLRALTRARPKVSPYPFTTKELVIGVFIDGACRVQLVDTPGLLDTPLERKSVIERQAILAMRHIASAIFFLVDPTETCGFPLEYQKTVHDQIATGFPVELIRVANKVDIASKEQIERMQRLFGCSDFIYISAEKRLNLKELVKYLKAEP